MTCPPDLPPKKESSYNVSLEGQKGGTNGQEELHSGTDYQDDVVAIALHDDGICQTLHGIITDTETECIASVQELAPLHELGFNVQPLAFLLILCDNIQDWGRHYKDETLEKPLREANIRLKDIKFESDVFTIQLLYTETLESLKFMHYKQTTFETLKSLLGSPDIKFIVEYWNRAKNEPSTYRFEMGG